MKSPSSPILTTTPAPANCVQPKVSHPRRSSNSSSSTGSSSNKVNSTKTKTKTSYSSPTTSSVKRMRKHHRPSTSSCFSNAGLSREIPWIPQTKTGMVMLSEQKLEALIRLEPVEKYYFIDEDLGSGNFSEVYRMRRKDTGMPFAGKFIPLARIGSDSMQVTADVLHEIAILEACKGCSRTVKLFEVYKDTDRMVLVLECANGGDLQSILDEDQVPLESDVARFVRQLLDGLAFMHDRFIVHLDIKPQNLVLTGSFPCCDVKICDFESSRIVKDLEVREILGTPDYVAPEILHYDPISPMADMWSVGVLTYVLLTGCSPFGGETAQETFFNITQIRLDFPEELFADISKDAQDFIRGLLRKPASSRLTAKQALQHPWLTRRSYRRRRNLYHKLSSKPPSMPALPLYKPPSKPPSLPSLLRSSQLLFNSSSQPSLTVTASTPCLFTSPLLTPLSPMTSFKLDLEPFPPRRGSLLLSRKNSKDTNCMSQDSAIEEDNSDDDHDEEDPMSPPPERPHDHFLQNSNDRKTTITPLQAIAPLPTSNNLIGSPHIIKLVTSPDPVGSPVLSRNFIDDNNATSNYGNMVSIINVSPPSPQPNPPPQSPVITTPSPQRPTTLSIRSSSLVDNGKSPIVFELLERELTRISIANDEEDSKPDVLNGKMDESSQEVSADSGSSTMSKSSSTVSLTRSSSQESSARDDSPARPTLKKSYSLNSPSQFQQLSPRRTSVSTHVGSPHKLEDIRHQLERKKDVNLAPRPKPWGRICKGSFNKALQNYKQRCGNFESVKEEDSSG